MSFLDGLNDEVDILRVVTKVEDGRAQEVEETLKRKLKARITIIREQQITGDSNTRFKAGRDSELTRRIIMEDHTYLEDMSFVYKIKRGNEVWKVVRARSQRNNAGQWHHVSGIIEFEKYVDDC